MAREDEQRPALTGRDNAPPTSALGAGIAGRGTVRTLADWSAEGRPDDIRGWQGADLLNWLAADGSPPPEPNEHRRERMRLPFTAAMCALVRDVAGDLQESHASGGRRGDVRPDRIWLDSDGRAHLMSEDTDSAPTGPDRLLVHHAPYWAPEQLAAVVSATTVSSANGSDQFDERCDIYALGLVLYELLTGDLPQTIGAAAGDVRPDVDEALRSLLAERLKSASAVPPGLAHIPPAAASILERCLAPRVEDRYASAAALAEDLHRLIHYRPLRHARNTSLLENVRNFGRRNPLLRALAATALVLVPLWLGWFAWCDMDAMRQLDELRSKLARDVGRAGPDPEIEARLQLAQELLKRPPRILPRDLFAARRQAAKRDLRQLNRKYAAMKLLCFQRMTDARRATISQQQMSVSNGELGIDPLVIYRVHDLPDWEDRIRGLPLTGRMAISQDVTEMLLLETDLLANNVSPRPGPPRLGISQALERLPAAYRSAELVDVYRGVSDGDGAPETSALAAAVRNEFDRYLVAVIATQRGEFETAKRHFELSFRERSAKLPPRFWARFHHAYCCQRLQQLEQAARGYRVCLGLRPDFAWAYHNLGVISTRQGRPQLAIAQLRRAAQVDPRMVAAHANLGVALYQTEQFAEALASLDRAVELNGHTAGLFLNRAAVREALQDLSGSRSDLETALRLDPELEPARRNIQRLDALQAAADDSPVNGSGK